MSEQPSKKKMSEMPGKSTSKQQRKIKSEAIPQWAQGLYYNEGVFSEALVYHDDEALYFEIRGKGPVARPRANPSKRSWSNTVPGPYPKHNQR